MILFAQLDPAAPAPGPALIFIGLCAAIMTAAALYAITCRLLFEARERQEAAVRTRGGLGPDGKAGR